MECCVCFEKTYYMYPLKCNHELCEKCSYQILYANSKNDKIRTIYENKTNNLL